MIDNYLNILSNNKIFIGIIMIFMNLGSKYLVLDIPSNIDKIFTNFFILRLIVLYAVFFMATRDIKISILLLLLFIIIIRFVLNEKSNFCFFNLNSIKVSDVEYENAKNIIKLYEEKNNK